MVHKEAPHPLASHRHSNNNIIRLRLNYSLHQTIDRSSSLKTTVHFRMPRNPWSTTVRRTTTCTIIWIQLALPWYRISNSISKMAEMDSRITFLRSSFSPSCSKATITFNSQAACNTFSMLQIKEDRCNSSTIINSISLSWANSRSPSKFLSQVYQESSPCSLVSQAPQPTMAAPPL